MKKFNQKEFQRLCSGKKVISIVKAVCGEWLGGGFNRNVYVYKYNPDYVVKVEWGLQRGHFANATEWRNYIDNKDWWFLSPWLAPIECINETGEIMVMKRIKHGRRKDYPKYIPAVFTDTKLENFGWIGDQFVCCDYSFFVLGTGKKQMKYAKWTGTLKKKV